MSENKVSTGEAFKALGKNTADVFKPIGKKETWHKVGRYFKGVGKAFAGQVELVEESK